MDFERDYILRLIQMMGDLMRRIAELMDRQEDVLVLYSTSHGGEFGLMYSDGDQGSGAISPVGRNWTGKQWQAADSRPS